MQNRRTSRTRRSDTPERAGEPDPAVRPRADAREGQTVPAQGETQDTVPRMPHERDESADSQSPEAGAHGIGQVAHDSAVSGQQDTSKGQAMDATYERLRQGADRPDKQFTPGGKPASRR